MSKYDVLVNVLDCLCDEADSTRRSYHPDKTDKDAVNVARAKAFLHLFLKVRFGLLSFEERESYVTEGSQDGGVDAYYIDVETRTIFFIQSKFRTNEKNFQVKPIELEELLRMDIDRMLNGEVTDFRQIEYNAKIKGLVQKIRVLDNISRYRYEVVILANVKDVARQKIQQLTGGFATQIFDYERCYQELLFPLVSANYYNFDDLHIALNLSNKNAGAKISYTVITEAAKLEITVVFVPTIEIAAAMHKYRNAILRYNPRSYLEHEGGGVNAEIRRSIVDRTTNEFALFNNGITTLSDGTFLNERIGKKDRAQLTLVNPQIINGGQTAYTLSQIYRELDEAGRASVFGEKEVLLKIITFDSEEKLPDEKKFSLIDAISRATNSQTVVSKADRRSNEEDLKKLQQRCFSAFGIWLERKRGEFGDGIREGYITPELITDRNLFVRAVAIANGELSRASLKKLFVKTEFAPYANASDEEFRRYHISLQILKWLYKGDRAASLRFSVVSRAYVALILIAEQPFDADIQDEVISRHASLVERRWPQFLLHLEECYGDAGDLWRINKKVGRFFDLTKYFRSNEVKHDVRNFFTITA